MGQVYYANEDGSGFELIEFDDALSFRDFTNKILVEQADEFDNKVIYSSCFCQEAQNVDVFGRPLINTTFIKCNLDNVILL